jgi:hypothetical protein
MTVNVLVGAGFSKAVDARYPTMTELSQLVLKDPEIRSHLRELDLPHNILGEGTSLNFENWVQILEESAVYQPDDAAIVRRHYVVQLIENFVLSHIRELSTGLSFQGNILNQLGKLITANANILSTNYDLIFESALDCLKSQSTVNASSPYSMLSGLFDFAYQRRNSAYLDGGTAGYDKVSALFKLHGSCNWYAFSEDRDDKFWIDVSLIAGSRDVAQNELSRESIRQMKPVSALPTSGKNLAIQSLPLKRIWREAFGRIQNGSALAIFGSAVNSSDSTLRSFLTEALPKDTPIFVWDLDPEKVKANLEEISPGSLITTFETEGIGEFCEFVSSYGSK